VGAENLRLNRRLITAQDDERRRTALELHEVGPCLFGRKRDRRGHFRFVPLQLAEGRDWFRALVRSIQARL
jgi:two-component system sensor histidine kinase UhpB